MTSSVVHLAWPGEYMPAASWQGAAAAAHTRPYTEHDDAFTDKAGGRAMWHADFAHPPSPPTCAKCQSPMFLLSQLYLPASTSASCLSAASLPRHMYVFACNKAECCASGDTGCFKVMRLAVNEQEEVPAHNTATDAAAVASASPAATPALAASSARSAAASAASPSSISASVAPAKASVIADEWGASASWSDEEGDAAAAAPKAKSATKSKKAKSKKSEWGSDNDDDDDDDAVLSALLAKQSLAQASAKSAKAAKAEKAAAKAAKAAAKEEQRAQAHQELMEKAMEARRNAEAEAEKGTGDSSSEMATDATAAASTPASASSRPAPTPAVMTCFRPFYLAWGVEPSSSASGGDLSNELRLLREFEARVAREGDDDERGELGALTAAGVSSANFHLASAGRESSTTSASTTAGRDDDLDSDDDEMEERREDDTQHFLDRVARQPEQCVRYYEPMSGAGNKGALCSTRAQVAFRDTLVKRAKADTTGAAAAAASASASSSSAASAASVTAAIAAAHSFPLHCPSCHAVRELEVQLLPKLLWELHVERADPRDPGMDWTTVDVYTCPKACRTNQYVEEAVHVQPPL